MTGKITIREAAANDATDLAELYWLLKPDRKITVDVEQLDELRANPRSFLLVCEVGGQAIATAHVSLCPDAMYGRQPFAVVENVVVAERFRSRGIGRTLMEHIDELCFSQGCSKIMLLSNAHRVDAHRFFSQRGYSSSKKVGFVKYRGDYKPDNSQ